MGKTGLAALIAAVFVSSPAVLAQDNELSWNMESAIEQLNRQGSDFETVLAQATVTWSESTSIAFPTFRTALSHS